MGQEYTRIHTFSEKVWILVYSWHIGYFAANGENGILDHYTGMGVECSRMLFKKIVWSLFFKGIFFFLVCRNQYNQACNIFGVDRICAQNSCGDECRFGYMNENCGFCLRGYFNVSGPNGYVNDQTGEGVRCTGN